MTHTPFKSRPSPAVSSVQMSHERAIELLSDSCFRGITTFNPEFKAALAKAIACLIGEKCNLER